MCWSSAASGAGDGYSCLLSLGAYEGAPVYDVVVSAGMPVRSESMTTKRSRERTTTEEMMATATMAVNTAHFLLLFCAGAVADV